MLRRIVVLLAALALPGLAGAQSSDYIRYYPPAGVSTSVTTPGFSYASNVGSLVNGTNAQTFNIYNTYTDASNWERLNLRWQSDLAVISTQKAGTGVLRELFIDSGGGVLNFQLATSTTFKMNSTSFYPSQADVSTNGGVVNQFSIGYYTRAIQGSKSKTLTDAAAAVSFVRIAVPTNGYIGGKVIWTANSTDGTNRLTTTGETYFAGADTAGTVTCGATSAVGTPATAYRRANTLVCTMTNVTSTTNCDLQVTCTDSLAGDQTPVFEWRLDMPSPATVTPQ